MNTDISQAADDFNTTGEWLVSEVNNLLRKTDFTANDRNRALELDQRLYVWERDWLRLIEGKFLPQKP